jgi:protein tyrosine/serine phosphatase
VAVWANALFVDHQILRYTFRNLHRLGGKAWRSSQPSPAQLADMKRRGVRTVVNLRGPSQFGSYILERDTCDRLGLAYRELKLRSREPPPLETLEEAVRLFDEIEYPALFHCKSGADRVGMASVLYLHLHEGRPIEEAQTQLGLRYLHVRQAQTGVLDYTFDLYRAARDAAAAEGRALDFMTWARTDYDPIRIARDFRASNLFSIVVDRILRRE